MVSFIATYFMSEAKSSVGETLFTIFSVLLDQSQHDPAGEERSMWIPNKVTIIITSWALTLAIISNCYKGDVLSYFVMETVPKTPNTIEDLATSGILITPNTRHQSIEQTCTTLKDYVLRDLAEGGGKYAKFYAHFQDDTRFLPGDAYDIVMNISQGKPVETDRGLIKMPQIFSSLSVKSG